MKTIKRIIILFTCLCLVSCSSSATPAIPEDDGKYEAVVAQELSDIYTGYSDMDKATGKYADFSYNYLRSSLTKGNNDFASPFSLYYALALLSNAAAGDTRKEIETVLGLSTNDLNHFLKDFDSGKANVEYSKANGIWFNTSNGLKLKEEFVNTINEFYGDCIHEDDFKNNSGLADSINKWTADITQGSIDNIISDSDIQNNTPFLLLNALATGEEWAYQFDESDTYPEVFNTYDSTVKMTDMMHQELEGYWHDSKSEGFIKPLMNGVNFIAILPNEGVDVYEYVNSLNSNTIRNYEQSYVGYENFKSMGWDCSVDLHITRLSFPKFKYETEYDLNDSLRSLGLKHIFDYSKSDFSNIAEGNEKLIDQIFVEKVKQKCSIEVNENEVRATVATMMATGFGGGGCSKINYIYHDVNFNRPFVFMLCSGANVPLFIGVVNDLGEVSSANVIKLQNITGGTINIRSIPSTNGEKLGSIKDQQIVYAYESKTAEGYTWYRIGEGKWIADKDGKWLKTLD